MQSSSDFFFELKLCFTGKRALAARRQLGACLGEGEAASGVFGIFPRDIGQGFSWSDDFSATETHFKDSYFKLKTKVLTFL